MRTWIKRLGSLKISVAVLIAIVVAMAAATIVESSRGSEAARAMVYEAAWFRLLLGLFAVSVLCSLVDRFPYDRKAIGYVLTHGAMLVILLGALVTLLFKVEGELALWEGEGSSEFALVNDPGDSGATGGTQGAPGPVRGILPFHVRLEAFEIDTYPGTERPAMFRSRVVVRDEQTGREFPAVIEMNRELSYRGYRLFQSRYTREKDRDQTVLLVSRDPGQAIVFAGYALLLLGMLAVIVTRMAQARGAARWLVVASSTRAARPPAAAAILLALLWMPAGEPARAALMADEGTADTLRRLPVQHDGRVMPLDTLAREAVLQVTGRARWKGADPTALVLGWTFDPGAWAREHLVAVPRPVAAALGLPPDVSHASFEELVRIRALRDLLAQAEEADARGAPLSPLQKKARALESRLSAMHGFLRAEAIAPLPGAAPSDRWSVPSHLHSPADLVQVLHTGVAASRANRALIDREVLYNRLRPTRIAMLVLALATLLSWAGWASGRRWLDALALAGLLAGFAVMTWGLAVRWQIAGRIPASNMYESMLFLGWGIGLFALVAFTALRNRLVLVNATAMSALTMTLTDLLPIDPFIHPMPPVLSGTPWLAIHVPIIMTSYSVLALGVLVAHLQIGVEIAAPRRRELVMRLYEILYWYMLVGATLLIAGIISGSVWAASSWGRYWGWDPKEVWSLIAFLAYLAILHGRFDRLVGPFGVAALSIVASWTILMTYIGVNFVLASGLHSYGFGSSAVVTTLAFVAVADATFLIGAMLWRRRRSFVTIDGGHVQPA